MRIEKRVMLVTGSTDGIGRETALELAGMGARIFLHGRNEQKGKATLEAIRDKTGNEKLEYLNADFASLENVRKLASLVREKTDKLHVLINNAGVFMRQRELTAEGYEMTFGVNHLAHFLLTHLLLDLLKASKPSRIITVASVVHNPNEVDFDNLQGEKYFSGMEQYALSKLCNIWFTRELARRLEGTGVTANCLHPGGIATKLLRTGFHPGGAPVTVGAQTPVYLATSPDVEGVTGKYFVNKRAASLSGFAANDELALKMWEVSERLTGIG